MGLSPCLSQLVSMLLPEDRVRPLVRVVQAVGDAHHIAVHA